MGCNRVIGVQVEWTMGVTGITMKMFQVKAELSLEQLRPPESSSSTPSASLSDNSSNFLRTKAAKQPVQCHLCRKWFHNKELNISE